MDLIKDQIMRGLADSALELAFGGEWINLENGSAEVLADFITTNVDDGTSAPEYRDLIGRGNLQSYADCLLVQARRKGSES